ncbi:DUF438 domain-containing protein [Terrisporobacter vanillatitrophus]|uniref:DUF438 domain-containing protein n=1 Tax=Terrisporobacter vanillatitrophus TaxID=3058402 RepID=UPI003367B844
MENKKLISNNEADSAVNEEKIKELTFILRRLNEEGLTEDLKENGLELVKSISPLELSIAEQSLIEEGMDPSELRHLCEIHMMVLKGELEKLQSNISKGHVLYTLIEEHELILSFLRKLDEVTNTILNMNKFDESRGEFGRVTELIDNILDAEPHHKREEDVLFPELESKGITGPTRIMRLEHEDLRKKKKDLKNLSESVSTLDFEEYKKELKRLSNDICFELKDHIFKENYILYPTALESIDSDAKWSNMKTECDNIGYCTFTPEDCK